MATLPAICPRAAAPAAAADPDAAGDGRRPPARLPPGFAPDDRSVLCGRGRECFDHPGNVRFRALVDAHLERYALAETKAAKTRLVEGVVRAVRRGGGAFCRRETAEDGAAGWGDVGDAVAREKVGALFRDRLHGMYRSSAKAKTEARRQRRRRHPHPRAARQGSSSSTSSRCSAGTATTIATSASGDSEEAEAAPGQPAPAPQPSDPWSLPAYPKLGVAEVQFSLMDLQPLLCDMELDFDDLPDFDFTEV